MLSIDFNEDFIKTQNGIDLLGCVTINSNTHDVVCTVSYEFLQDIHNSLCDHGFCNYEDTFSNNKTSIETIAEELLNKLTSAELKENPIRVFVYAADIPHYNL